MPKITSWGACGFLKDQFSGHFPGRGLCVCIGKVKASFFPTVPPNALRFILGQGGKRSGVVYTEKRWAPSVALRRPSFISTLLMPLGCCRNAFSRALGPLSVVLRPRVMAQAGGSNAGCSCSVTLQCKIWITLQSLEDSKEEPERWTGFSEDRDGRTRSLLRLWGRSG